MSAKKQKMRPEFIALIIFVIIIVFAVASSWWKTHSVIGWSVIGVLIIAFGFALYKYPPFRTLVSRTVKQTSKKVIYEDIASDREPLPSRMRIEVYKRSKHSCENPNCRHSFIHIHHIDMNNSNNQLNNLIALCPNCHTDAHHGKFTPSQLYNWLKADYYLNIKHSNL